MLDEKFLPTRFMLQPPVEVMRALKRCAQEQRRDPKAQAVVLLETALRDLGYLPREEPQA